MKIISNITKAMGLFMAASIYVAPAFAELNAATLVLSKTALQNIKAVQLVESAVAAGFATAEKQPTVRGQLLSHFHAEMRKIEPSLYSYWALQLAGKYNLAQLGDVVEFTDIAFYSHEIIAETQGKPAPSRSEMTPAQSATYDRLSTKPHVVKFMKDLFAIATKDTNFNRVQKESVAYSNTLKR